MLNKTGEKMQGKGYIREFKKILYFLLTEEPTICIIVLTT